MWFKRKARNRRLSRGQVLDVKVRSSVAAKARGRMLATALAVIVGTFVSLFLFWRAGEWVLDRLVYQNSSFAIRKIDIYTDGVISPEQLRRWSSVRTGDNLFALDLARVQRDLELVPRISSVSIERILPDTLRIRVAEREPVAQVNVPRQRPGGAGLELVVYELDIDGYVMIPLDPRQRAVPLLAPSDRLPAISGINTAELQPGRRLESAPVQSALQLIRAFENSPMAGLTELRRIDVSSVSVLTVTTDEGSQITFGLKDFDRQLRRWQKVYEECARYRKTIVSLDLAVSDNAPLRIQEAVVAPPPVQRTPDPPRPRRRNV